MRHLLQRITKQYDEWCQRRDFARLTPEYRRLFTAMGLAPKIKCGLHTGSLLDCQYDTKGRCIFLAGRGVKCVSQKRA